MNMPDDYNGESISSPGHRQPIALKSRVIWMKAGPTSWAAVWLKDTYSQSEKNPQERKKSVSLRIFL